MVLRETSGVLAGNDLQRLIAVLLARLCGSRDISVACPAANRDHAEVAGLIGFFVNMLVSRRALPGRPGPGTWLAAAMAILFRGFTFKTAHFQTFCQVLCPDLATYAGGNSPRQVVSGKVYTSTEFAKDAKLPLHNEASYLKNMPRMIFFLCEIAPTDRGQTPLADCRSLYKKVAPEVVQRFTAHGVTYFNNLHGGFGFGKSWQQTFETEDKAALERRLKTDGYEFTWKADGGLRCSITCAAIRTHPFTEETVWANQAEQWHPSALDTPTREALSELFSEEDMPHLVSFGDGSPIPLEDLQHIRQVMDQEERIFQWQQGDVLVCDNFLVAHGRQPFSGERRILAAMG